QPFPRHACTGLRLVQHGAHDQLDPERASRTVSEIEDGVGRERARLGAVPDAAAGRSIPDASLGSPAIEAAAERIHEQQLLLHDAADGDDASEGAREHAGDDQGRDPAHVLVRLAAFRFRPAAGNLRPAVPDRAGQAQYSGAERRADLQSRPDAGEEAGDGVISGDTFSSWPGLSRPSTSWPDTSKKDVDARHKAGHD